MASGGMGGAALALLAAGLICAPAPARIVPDQPLDDVAVANMHSFASCIADLRPREAARALVMDYQSPAFHEALTTITKDTNGCAHIGRLGFNQMLLAGGLAERLVVEQAGARDFGARTAYDPSKPPIAIHRPWEATAICVIRADPVGTWAIFATEPASPGEQRAMQTIASVLVGCVSAGKQATFNRPGFRASLALAAYRLIRSPAAPAQGS